jgi:Tat protein secretion system quality control protein TatD with DNase activity
MIAARRPDGRLPGAGPPGARTAAARGHSHHEADDDTIAILGMRAGEVSGVLHCFTGGPPPARAGLDLLACVPGRDRYLPKAAELRETVRGAGRAAADGNRQPLPGARALPRKRNEPAHVARGGHPRALHGLSADELGRRAAANFHTLFRP